MRGRAGALVWAAAARCPVEPRGVEAGPPSGCMLGTSTSAAARPLSRAEARDVCTLRLRPCADPALGGGAGGLQGRARSVLSGSCAELGGPRSPRLQGVARAKAAVIQGWGSGRKRLLRGLGLASQPLLSARVPTSPPAHQPSRWGGIPPAPRTSLEAGTAPGSQAPVTSLSGARQGTVGLGKALGNLSHCLGVGKLRQASWRE